MIKVLLWDIDGTILNFKEAEKEGIRKCFEKFELGECTDEMIERYSAINDTYWKRLERGEITKPQVLVGRFLEFFEQENIDTSCAEAFNQEYQIRLGDTICFNNQAYGLMKELKGQVRQYAVTNGTATAQERKLERSGLNDIFDGVFISEEVGIEKPDKRFFDKVFAEIGHYEKDEMMIIGDSLTSDMQGGNNAGIICCWYNPEHLDDTVGLKIDYVIDDLQKIKTIL